jgi:hypothetical protein
MSEKSDIRGFGYKTNHIWKNMGSRDLPYPARVEDKCTTYKCSKCNETFYHYYGIEPIITFALEDAKVKEECV